MFDRARALLVGGSLLALAACSTAAGAGEGGANAPGLANAPAPSTTEEDDGQSTSSSATTDDPTTTSRSTTTDAATTTERATTTQRATTTTERATTTTTEKATTTTTTEPPLPVHNAKCVVVIEAGDSLSLIAERIDDPLVTVANLQGENFLTDADVINEGEYLDVCVDNGIDDVTGEERPNPAIAEGEARAAVEVQQRKLNELFAGLGSPELLVDGISGPLTRQMLCAARIGLGLPVSTADMQPGSEEESALFAADRIRVPFNEAIKADRWALVDRTCQIMYVGQGTEQVSFVFPVSTGEDGHETDLNTLARAFRYDPALDNGGWHNSTTYPVAADNPLNGNMYRPVYFNDGEAIHGASVVPPYPRSKGCVRMHVEQQDMLVAWLGLDGVGGPVWDSGQINFAVTVQGDYAG